MSDIKAEENRIKEMTAKFAEYDSVEVIYEWLEVRYLKKGLFLGVIFDLIILTRSSYTTGNSFTISGAISVKPCRIVLFEKRIIEISTTFNF